MRVTHVASRDSANAAARAEQAGAEPCTYEELPAGADVVVVTTPPERHVEDALQALRAGAAAIVEKPLCTTLAQADALVTAATGARFRVGYAENLAFAPVIERAVALRRGLGPLHHLEARALQSRPDWGDFLTESWGGGVLFDLGVHPIAVALLMAAPARVESVTARLDAGEGLVVDDHALVELVFDDGLRARVEASWRSSSEESTWDLQAASATGVVRAELLPSLVLEHDGRPVSLPAPLTPDFAQLDQFGYLGQLRSFTADFEAGRRPGLDAVFGREVLDIVCAAYASAGRDGATEAVPFAGRRDRTPLQLWRG